jgi:hypothetical protein
VLASRPHNSIPSGL